MRQNKSNEYGILLREARRKSGKTFEEITEKFGWSKGTLLMHEKNLSKPTDFGRVIELAVFLGVSPELMIEKLIVDREEAILQVVVKNKSRLKEAVGSVMSWYGVSGNGKNGTRKNQSTGTTRNASRKASKKA